MAKSSFSVSKLLGWLKGFLRTVPSPLGGYNIEDVKVNTKGDIYSALFQFKAGTGGVGGLTDDTGNTITDISGKEIPLTVLIRAINFQTTFEPILSGLNKAWADKDKGKLSKDAGVLLNVLLGERDTKEDYSTDNSAEAARKRGADGSMKGGLLGIDFSKVSELPTSGVAYAGKFWSWKNIAEQFLVYSLECEMPGKDYGAIENQEYANCSKLISEYLMKVGSIDTIDEVKVNTFALVLPILASMQAALIKYYEAARAKYDLDYVEVDYDEDNGVKEESEYNESQNPKEAQTKAVTDDKGEFVGHVDISTPEGAAQAEVYRSMGYTVEESKRIKVTLQKIQGSDSIDMLALQSTCAPADTLNYIDDIINQDQFFDVLTEEPQSFDITIDSDGYDIEQCECCEVDPCTSLQEVFKSGIRAYRNLYTLHWMANGNDMMKLHNLTEDMYKELIDEIDIVGELLVEKCGTVPALDFPCDYIPVQQYDFQTGLDQIKSLIQVYIDCIDCAYPNQTSDVQSTLDEWLRYWNKEMNYFVKRQEE